MLTIQARRDKVNSQKGSNGRELRSQIYSYKNLTLIEVYLFRERERDRERETERDRERNDLCGHY